MLYLIIGIVLLFVIAWIFGGDKEESGPEKKAKRYKNIKKKIAHIPNNVDQFVIIDTETTGFTKNSEIIEISIISLTGEILLDQRIMPKGRIPGDATKAHKITRKMLKGCPSWPDISEVVEGILQDKTVIAYNAEFDIRLLMQTADKWDCPIKMPRSICLMKIFAEFFGEWNDYRNSYRWHKLTDVAYHFDIDTTNAHSALADCQMARKLLLKVIDAVTA